VPHFENSGKLIEREITFTKAMPSTAAHATGSYSKKLTQLPNNRWQSETIQLYQMQIPKRKNSNLPKFNLKFQIKSSISFTKKRPQEFPMLKLT